MSRILDRLVGIVKGHRELILYLFFGVCTTLINTVCYRLFCDRLGIGNIASTVLAWLAAVIFAFVTNRSCVFNSKHSGFSALFREAASFFGCRLLTGVLDIGIMAFAVDLMHWNGTVWKLISNVIVTVINYVASKLWIFRKGKA